MAQLPKPNTLNNLAMGLKTEFTGLNFPENGVYASDNFIYNRIGNAERREGINQEKNGFPGLSSDVTGRAITHYRWRNAGGTGSVQVVVKQIGKHLYFYRSSNATTGTPLSQTYTGVIVDLSQSVAMGATFDETLECQYSDGNGYLFVFHPSIDPVYIKYNVTDDSVVVNGIFIRIRDFAGASDGLGDTIRPSTLSTEHLYNLYNQGWSNQASWSTHTSTTFSVGAGSTPSLTVDAGLTAAPGDKFSGYWTPDSPSAAGGTFSGTVLTYSGTTMSISIATITGSPGQTSSNADLFKTNQGLIGSWHTAVGNYPANSDVWWAYKDTTGIFNPSATFASVTQSNGLAGRGSIIFSAFDQDRNVGDVSGITVASTAVRPRTGCWFSSRIWFAGTDDFFNSTGTDITDYSWTETIYFSQIAEKTNQFGKCYQNNDPTSQDFFDLLPTDGGTIKIVGCGPIYKLYPLQNGILVFAANGVWFITGSTGIGFTANDYTINKLSSVQSISGGSFVDIQGYPVFWNEEAIYTVSLGKTDNIYDASRGAAGGAGVQIQPLTYTTIATFYDNIPLTSKKYVKGDYDAVNFIVQWTFRSTEASTVRDRYKFDRILNYNLVTQAFYPFTVGNNDENSTSSAINGVLWVQNPASTPAPIFKYPTTVTTSGATDSHTFAEERDTSFVDWADFDSVDYTSFFTSGYRLHGAALMKTQAEYIRFFFNNISNCSYKVQGIWDYAIDGNSNKYTPLELVTITEDPTLFNVVNRRHRMQGRGLALQFKITSVTGQPLDILGWAVEDRINQGV
jgi:hypothetical protein